MCDFSCMYMVPYICLCKAVCDLSYICIWYPIFVYIRLQTSHTLSYINKYRVPYTYKTSHTLSYINKYRIPYTYKTSHTLSYISKYRIPYIWYPIFVYVRQCVTCLVCIWYPIFVYVRQCVTCLYVYGTLVNKYRVPYISIRQVTHCLM
jgi:hypothetical protein